MSKNGTAGAAFPRAAAWSPGGASVSKSQDGMTLRDYFAAKALQGLAAHPEGAVIHSGETPPEANARVAYAYADAMLAARDES